MPSLIVGEIKATKLREHYHAIGLPLDVRRAFLSKLKNRDQIKPATCALAPSRFTIMQLFHERHELSLCAAQGHRVPRYQSHTISHFPLNLDYNARAL